MYKKSALLIILGILQIQHCLSAEPFQVSSVAVKEEVFERVPSGVSAKVTTFLQEFDPSTDIAFFDWDETIAGKRPSTGDVREIRSQKTLVLFTQLRADNPGRVFLYSNGNAFIFDQLPDGKPILEATGPYVPSFLNGVQAFRTNGIIYYSDDGQLISKSNTTSRFVYFPTYHAFYTPKTRANMLTASRIPLGHLKGYYFGEVLDILGFSAKKPLRRIYFVDNDETVIEGMRLAVEKLKESGVIQESLKSVHVPFYDDVR